MEKFQIVSRQKKINANYGEDKDNGFRERKRKSKKKRMEVGRREFKRSQRDKVSRVYSTEERRSGKAYNRRQKESNGSNKENVKHRERIFKESYLRRMKMFEALVESTGLSGAEIWGWRKEERLNEIKRKYMKWILGLERATPNYILIEEGKITETKIKAMKRAVKYEEEARKSGKILVSECMEEKERERVGSRKGRKMGKNEKEGDGRERIRRKERERKREKGEDIVQK